MQAMVNARKQGSGLWVELVGLHGIPVWFKCIRLYYKKVRIAGLSLVSSRDFRVQTCLSAKLILTTQVEYFGIVRHRMLLALSANREVIWLN